MSAFGENRPRGKCLVCGKPVVLQSTRGKGSTGTCSRVCASTLRYSGRYTGPRSELYSRPIDLAKKRLS